MLHCCTGDNWQVPVTLAVPCAQFLAGQHFKISCDLSLQHETVNLKSWSSIHRAAGGTKLYKWEIVLLSPSLPLSPLLHIQCFYIHYYYYHTLQIFIYTNTLLHQINLYRPRIEWGDLYLKWCKHPHQIGEQVGSPTVQSCSLASLDRIMLADCLHCIVKFEMVGLSASVKWQCHHLKFELVYCILVNTLVTCNV